MLLSLEMILHGIVGQQVLHFQLVRLLAAHDKFYKTSPIGASKFCSWASKS